MNDVNLPASGRRLRDLARRGVEHVTFYVTTMNKRRLLVVLAIIAAAAAGLAALLNTGASQDDPAPSPSPTTAARSPQAAVFQAAGMLGQQLRTPASGQTPRNLLESYVPAIRGGTGYDKMVVTINNDRQPTTVSASVDMVCASWDFTKTSAPTITEHATSVNGNCNPR